MDVQVFVQHLKSLLDERGISYSRAGRESGAGEDFIRNMERRNSAPSFVKVQQMADYLGVTTSELLGEKKDPATVSGDGQAEKLAKALEGIGIDVDKLSDAEISRIARLAKAALEE